VSSNAHMILKESWIGNWYS